MALVRICKEVGCKVRLSYYNSTNYCCLHPHVPRRLMAELEGDVVLRDDDFARGRWREHAPKEILTWREHMFSDRFLAGEPDELTKAEKLRYRKGEWL